MLILEPIRFRVSAAKTWSLKILQKKNQGFRHSEACQNLTEAPIDFNFFLK